MQSYIAVKIIIILVFVVIRIVYWAARKPKQRPPVQPNYQQPPPFPGHTGYQQPPPFPGQNSFQQPPPFPQQNYSNPVPPPMNYAPPGYNSPVQQPVNDNSVYCKYCGKKFNTVTALTSDYCFKNPDTSTMHKHVLFQGQGKPNIGY